MHKHFKLKLNNNSSSKQKYFTFLVKIKNKHYLCWEFLRLEFIVSQEGGQEPIITICTIKDITNHYK